MNNALNAILYDPDCEVYNLKIDTNDVNGIVSLKNDNNCNVTCDLYSTPLYVMNSANANSTILNKNILKFINVKDVEVIVPNKVVKVTFEDGLYEKTVCHEDDVFDLEIAITICMLKHVLGGTANYNKMIKNIIRNYSKKLKEEEENKEIAERKLAKSIRNHAKRQNKRAEKEATARELRIREQAEAIILANELMNKSVETNILTTESIDEQGDK